MGFTLLFLGWGNPWDSPSAASCCRSSLRCRRIHPSIWFYSFKCFVFQKPPEMVSLCIIPPIHTTMTNPIVYDPQWLVHISTPRLKNTMVYPQEEGAGRSSGRRLRGDPPPDPRVRGRGARGVASPGEQRRMWDIGCGISMGFNQEKWWFHEFNGMLMWFHRILICFI